MSAYKGFLEAFGVGSFNQPQTKKLGDYKDSLGIMVVNNTLCFTSGYSIEVVTDQDKMEPLFIVRYKGSFIKSDDSYSWCVGFVGGNTDQCFKTFFKRGKIKIQFICKPDGNIGYEVYHGDDTLIGVYQSFYEITTFIN